MAGADREGRVTFPSPFDARRLLVLDGAGTLLGGDETARRELAAALESVRPAVALVYIADHDLADLDGEQALPVPDYVVTNAGTEIVRLPGGHPVEEWESAIRAGFDRQAIVDFVADWTPTAGEWAPVLQPAERQMPFRISYALEDAPADTLSSLQRDLQAAGFPVKLTYTDRRCLDLVPERAGLSEAVRFLVDSLMLAPSQVFVAAGAAYAAALFRYGYQGIVVGNATPALRQAAELRAYFSREPFAAGTLEGLRHYGFFRAEGRERQGDLAREAYDRAIESLRRNITPMGFSAASLADNPLTETDSNYFSVWSRDGIKTGLWCLGLNDPDLTECFRRTLELMAAHQTVSGQIPANVQIATGKPDYGGIGNIASIDSVIWFVIGGCRFAARTGDRAFLEQLYPHLARAIDWLRAHDSNNCGLLELPESSDWMDLFPRSYNVLYDEILWYQAVRDFQAATAALGRQAPSYEGLDEQIRRQIMRQFWPTARKLSETRENFAEKQFTLGEAQYLLAQISPFDFSWRCDVYANLLAALMGLLDERRMEQLFHFLWGVGVNAPYPVKCLYPAVQSGASDWKDYFITNLLNLPDHYHNGGIWPFIGALWVRFLAHAGRPELAHQELGRLAEACRLGIYGEWEFNEWLHGQTGRPMGKAHQAWSAAGYIAAYQAVHQETVAPDFQPLTADMFGGRR